MLRYGVLGALALVLMMVGGCEDPRKDVSYHRGSAMLRLIHASPSAPAVDWSARFFNVESKLVDSALNGRLYPLAGYVKLYTTDPLDENGYSPLTLLAYRHGSKELIVPAQSKALDTTLKYSVLLADNNGLQEFVWLTDEYAKPDSDKYNIRFVNLSGRSSQVVLRATNDTYNSGPQNFGQATAFTQADWASSDFVAEADGVQLAGIFGFAPVFGKTYTFYYQDRKIGWYVHE